MTSAVLLHSCVRMDGIHTALVNDSCPHFYMLLYTLHTSCIHGNTLQNGNLGPGTSTFAPPFFPRIHNIKGRKNRIIKVDLLQSKEKHYFNGYTAKSTIFFAILFTYFNEKCPLSEHWIPCESIKSIKLVSLIYLLM